jgi:hypothetical protein
MPEVQRLAAAPSMATTQDHYGHYLSVLARLVESAPFGDDARRNYRMWAAVLITAGANGNGVRSALRVAGYES